ncbi:hypothetical protein JXE69_000361 [Salmonella enterica subsp. houtenae serovar 17:z29:-]|nr:hypothetical protein [Salmonella enterica subsp. houtenae serovar 17:z29:-]
MHIKYLFKIALIAASVFYSSLSISMNEDGIVIYDMPQDLQDFFETADACEGWISDLNPHLEEPIRRYIEKAIQENCSDIERKLLLLKNKYKNNKDYSERLTVYDDTIIIYNEYKKNKND